MIEEAYVSFETAKLLKEKGFDEPCRYYYSSDGKIYRVYGLKDRNYTGVNTFSVPFQALAMKWLREVHNIHIGINPISGKGYNAIIYDVADFDDYGIISDTEFFFHVEEACEAAIKYCIENLI